MLQTTLTVTLPESAFRRLKRAAELTYRTVDEVVVTAVNTVLPPSPDLPADLEDELAAMSLFSDQALWAAAESSLTPAQQSRLGQLTEAGGSRALTAAESAELAHLVGLYDRSVLRRARAFAILALRGYEIPERADLPASENGDNADS